MNYNIPIPIALSVTYAGRKHMKDIEKFFQELECKKNNDRIS